MTTSNTSIEKGFYEKFWTLDFLRQNSTTTSRLQVLFSGFTHILRGIVNIIITSGPDFGF